MSLEIIIIPVLKDNYAYLLTDSASGKTAIVDPGEAGPVLEACTKLGKKLDHILITHHHYDHTSGNAEIVAQVGCPIIGPTAEAHAINGLSTGLNDGDVFVLGGQEATVISTPGHTVGHIVYYFAQADALFAGDALFLGGCGRPFELSAQTQGQSMRKIMNLPRSTNIYVGHEYTQTNAAFALSLEPDNGTRQQYKKDIDDLRAAGKPTVPGNFGTELDNNPFLRFDTPQMRALLNLDDDTPGEEVFATIRELRNDFATH